MQTSFFMYDYTKHESGTYSKTRDPETMVRQQLLNLAGKPSGKRHATWFTVTVPGARMPQMPASWRETGNVKSATYGMYANGRSFLKSLWDGARPNGLGSVLVSDFFHTGPDEPPGSYAGDRSASCTTLGGPHDNIMDLVLHQNIPEFGGPASEWPAVEFRQLPKTTEYHEGVKNPFGSSAKQSGVLQPNI